VFYIFFFGIVSDFFGMALYIQGLGVIHVLTGPDHLAALATLSAMTSTTTESKTNSSWMSFWLGIQWGVGHSTGLVLVGSVFIVLDVYQKSHQQYDDDDDTTVVTVPQVLSHVLDCFVGLFMLFLGLYGIRQAFFHRTQRRFELLLRQEDDNNNNNHNATTSIPVEQAADHAVYKEMEEDGTHYQSHYHHHNVFCPKVGCTTNTKTMALLAGIVHGVAGPDGVLGVIPAIQLHDWKLASLYLGSFCLSSTLTMGWFASIYAGTLLSFCSGSVGPYREQGKEGVDMEFRLQCGSASLSLVVGILWLVLLSLGKLDVFFE
jgi:hypothetical protein